MVTVLDGDQLRLGEAGLDVHGGCIGNCGIRRAVEQEHRAGIAAHHLRQIPVPSVGIDSLAALHAPDRQYSWDLLRGGKLGVSVVHDDQGGVDQDLAGDLLRHLRAHQTANHPSEGAAGQNDFLRIAPGLSLHIGDHGIQVAHLGEDAHLRGLAAALAAVATAAEVEGVAHRVQPGEVRDVEGKILMGHTDAVAEDQHRVGLAQVQAIRDVHLAENLALAVL